ncbi:hypothetical protein [Gilvimarinus agarilyticus]|uniref:hypothetical protein n=1 Tax=Gilvimarinus agarilyticus TaxID=679259 RepID=UPI00059EFAC3|nr:hypothetical protein [Gilvimarinus agarilyticus]
MNQQKGSVLAEFVIVVGFVVLPMIMLVPVLYKYIENRQMVEQAARYAVWERVAYFRSEPGGAVSNAPVKSDVAVSNEIQNRIFSHSKSKVTSEHSQQTSLDSINPTLMVKTMSNGELEPIYELDDSQSSGEKFVTVTTSEHSPDGFAAVQGALGDVLSLTSGFNPNENGIYQSEVRVSLKPIAWFPELSSDVIELSRTGALLAEGWSVGGPHAAESTIEGLVPITTFFDTLGVETVFGALGWLPLFKEVSWMDLGKVEVDAVPCARLGESYNGGQLRTPQSCLRRLTPQLNDYGYSYEQ